MATSQIRIAGEGLLFVLIFLSGFWLSHLGKPYGTLLFTVHKLIALGALVFLAVTAWKTHQAVSLSLLQTAVVLITGLFFVATVATGGLLSTGKPMPSTVLWVHRVLPYLTTLLTACSLYLLLVTGRALARG